jgi:hypothetical protein
MAKKLWDGDTYREAVVKYLADNKVDLKGKLNYQFGIFTGTTLVFIYEMFRKYGLDVEGILAFDSFEGLPDEQPGVPRNEIWNRHEFNMKYVFGTQSIDAIIAKIEAELPDHGIPIRWYAGYFSEVLTPAFLKAHPPMPAFWVDLDVDLYISAKQVLEYMLEHKLILPGTVISYDDWGGTEEYKGGESLAHKEACERFKVKCDEIHTYTNGPHTQKAFVVRSIGK